MDPIDYLVFDTETTGFPKNWKAPYTDTKNWPHIVQIAWQAYDSNKHLLESRCHIIKPKGFKIPQGAVSVHGITTEKAMAEGIDAQVALDRFSEVVRVSNKVIAHNLDFDEKVVRAAFIREDVEDHFNGTKKYCTKEAGTDVCRLPGKYGYKWPRLGELYDHLFDDHFDETHHALNDVKATAKCFFELQAIKAI